VADALGEVMAGAGWASASQAGGIRGGQARGKAESEKSGKRKRGFSAKAQRRGDASISRPAGIHHFPKSVSSGKSVVKAPLFLPSGFPNATNPPFPLFSIFPVDGCPSGATFSVRLGPSSPGANGSCHQEGLPAVALAQEVL